MSINNKFIKRSLAVTVMSMSALSGLFITSNQVKIHAATPQVVVRAQANKATLLKTIRKAQAINGSKYTTASFSSMQKVLATVVNNTYHNANASQSLVNEANSWLNASINHLVLQPAWHAGVSNALTGRWLTNWYKVQTAKNVTYYLRSGLYLKNNQAFTFNYIGATTNGAAPKAINPNSLQINTPITNISYQYQGNNVYYLKGTSIDPKTKAATSVVINVKLMANGKLFIGLSTGDLNQAFYLFNR